METTIDCGECIDCECGSVEEGTPISLAKLTITDISRAMIELIKCDPFKAVYFRGRMISPTQPSLCLKW